MKKEMHTYRAIRRQNDRKRDGIPAKNIPGNRRARYYFERIAAMIGERNNRIGKRSAKRNRMESQKRIFRRQPRRAADILSAQGNFFLNRNALNISGKIGVGRIIPFYRLAEMEMHRNGIAGKKHERQRKRIGSKAISEAIGARS